MRLLWPLIIDQILIVLIGIIDTVMVAHLGDAAVGGVSLVDSINVLVVNVFSALTTGGAVVCSQYLGRRNPSQASASAKQLVYITILISGALVLLMFPGRLLVLKLIYGHIDPGIMKEAEIYFFFTILSYPFIALYLAGAALFRTMGNSRVGMWISFLINVLNAVGNAVFIYLCGWGVAGAAAATLISRFVAALVIMYLLANLKEAPINIRGMYPVRILPSIIKSILKVAVPNGIEGATFQVGKLALAQLVSTFGAAAIAGNAVGNIFMTMGNLPGIAIAQAMIPVVGQSVGAGDFEGAKRYTKKLMFYSYVAMISFNTLNLLSMPLVFKLFAMSAESLAYGRLFGTIFCTAAMVFWIPAYGLPFALRAAGDAKYTMIVSAIAMWVVRVGVAYLLAYAFGVGAVCVWISMVCEWLVRGGGYIARWKSGKWQEKRII
ncbi:MAG: MATE family efflux transporter [Treponema sp.]|nr:MATE family efflux transporter [Treponema sp.]